MMPASRARRKDEAKLQWSEVPAARPVSGLLDDVRTGLLRKPRSMPPKYFYDALGAELFELICRTPEYYPTRTEDALLARIAPELLALTRPRHLVELGSGSSRKTRRLLEAWSAQPGPRTYWPFDVSREMLLASGAELEADFAGLEVHALVGDYLAGLAHLPIPSGPALWLFLGGTIGNFAPAHAEQFLHELSQNLGASGYLLLAVDRVKDPGRLEAAYADAAGVTARFNKNLLSVLNRELGADFVLDNFQHRAVFNRQAEQIEMYLDVSCTHSVDLGRLNMSLDLHAGESILTEISRKFSADSLAGLLERGSLQVCQSWHADGEAYSLVLAKPAQF